MPEITRYNDILSSEYSEAIDLYQGNEFTEIEVYVEGYEDIGFWYAILAPYEKYGFRFNINIPSVTNLKTGKKALLDLINEKNLGKYLILCVDSDYDYLLRDATDNSSIINANPYIFQTYTYSIENLYCYAESLQSVLVKATNRTEYFMDIPKFMAQYSKVIYPLFLWSVYLYKIQNFNYFNIEDFCSEVRFEDRINVFGYGENEFIHLNDKVQTKILELEQTFPNETNQIEQFKTELNNLGLTEENTYLFIKGHTLKDNVILMFLNPLFDNFKRKTHQDISQSFVEVDRQNDVRDEFVNLITNIRTVLELNTEFTNCFLFQKLRNDLDNYISLFETGIQRTT